MAYATKDDVANHWRTLTTAEGVAAESYLDAVATLIDGEFLRYLGLSEIPADKLASAKTVSIDIVKTAIDTGQWSGHTSYSRTRTEGPRAKTDTGALAAPGGALELQDWQRELLGLPVNPAPHWNFPQGDY